MVCAAGGATMEISTLLGEGFKILSFKYNPKSYCFDVECVMPGMKVPAIYALDKRYFPQHAPIPLLDEMVQIGETVHVWIKEAEVLKSEGWKDVTKHTLASPDSPFKISKNKKVYLGGAHKGTVHINEKFQPFVLIKGYRFSVNEIKCVLRMDTLIFGKSAEVKDKNGNWIYNSEKQTIVTPNGNVFNNDGINTMIDLLRQARLI